MRDSLGRFVKGHRALPCRDSRFGRFVKKDSPTRGRINRDSMDFKSRYSMAAREVDIFLKKLKEVDNDG